LSGIVHDICISIVDDFECVAGACDEGGGGRPEVGAGVLDACCFITHVSTSYLPSNFGRRNKRDREMGKRGLGRVGKRETDEQS
jgi:hypothetical protein